MAKLIEMARQSLDNGMKYSMLVDLLTDLTRSRTKACWIANKAKESE